MAMATTEATTLTALLKEAAAAFPTRRAVAVPGRLELTHAALDALVDAAAARLAADAGVLPGHVVALSFPNTVENGSHGGGAAGSLSPNDPSDVALFLHTSGTTSRPKGVPLKQRNLAASVRNIRSVYRLAETDATVVVLPLFHVHGLLCALLSSLASGASVALPAAGRFSASTFWADMRASGATWYTAVPTIHQIILDRHASRPEAYPALRFIRSCSASLAPAILERLEAAFSAPVLEAYAMTEASHLMTSNPLPEDGPRKPGSVGRAVGQELAVLDEEGRLVAAGSPGEVCVRGDNVTAGYKGNPEANEAAFRELINRGGEKISPIEVDAVLLGLPGVAQAVSFGVPDDKYGEEINCAVIPRDGSALREEEVLAHCRRNLASFKVPKKVFITDDLPKTATGKIQRRIVAQHFVQPTSA
uniref:4-coumarate--CoA ligase n=1 Tax=Zea mays TaxID=4577 RepID=E7DDV3_MAIZE|nr:peroxisomal-CoA synthetase [Zea mays]